MDPPTRRRWILPVVAGLAALAAFLAFARKSPEDLADSLRQVSLWTIAGALGLHLAAHGFWALRLRIVGHGLGTPITFQRAAKAVTAGVFGAAVTPARVGGEALRTWTLGRRVGGMKATRVIAAERSVDLVFMVGAGLLAAASIPVVYGDAPQFRILALTGVAIFGGALVLLILLLSSPRAAGRIGAPVLALVRRLMRKRGENVAVRVREVVSHLRKDLLLLLSERPGVLVVAVAATVAIWVTEFSVLWLLLRGVGADVEWLGVMLAALLVTLVTTLPFTPGGAGLAEITMFAVLSPWVDGATQAAVVVLLWRVLTFYWDLAAGGLLAAHEVVASKRPIRPVRHRPGLTFAWVAVGVVAYYEIGNHLFTANLEAAQAHARWMWDLERSWGLDIEHAVQSFVNGLTIDGFAWLRRALIYVYLGPHFIVTGAFALWLVLKRRHAVTSFRNTLAIFTVLAFGFQWYYPMAPPWAMADLFHLDYTLPDIGVDGRSAEDVTNTMAAFPSVHTGWALIVGVYGAVLTRGVARAAWMLYPALVVITIMATGNHLVIDAIAAVPFALVAYLGDAGLRRLGTSSVAHEPEPMEPDAATTT